MPGDDAGFFRLALAESWPEVCVAQHALETHRRPGIGLIVGYRQRLNLFELDVGCHDVRANVANLLFIPAYTCRVLGIDYLNSLRRTLLAPVLGVTLFALLHRLLAPQVETPRQRWAWALGGAVLGFLALPVVMGGSR